MIHRSPPHNDRKSTKATNFWQAYAQLGSRKDSDTKYPQLRDWYAVPAVAITTVIMAYSGLFGIYPILLLYAMWLPLAFYKGRFIVQPSRDILLPLIFAGYCLLSILWSAYPDVSTRTALEYTSMIICTIIISRIVGLETFIKGITTGVSLVLIVTLLNGNYGKDFFSGTYALVGLFGSHNQVGLYAEIGAYASLLYLLAKNHWPEKILFSLFPFLLCALCLVLSRSASSIVTFVLVLIVSYAAYLIAKLAPHRRRPVFVLGIIFAIIIAVTGVYLGQQDTLFHMMGKDATLTGRTYLWAEGTKVGLKDPILGHGYNAFWVAGQIEAERYWFEFQMYNRSGFHFHNLYVQTFVDLGAVGLLLMLLMILLNCIKGFRYIIDDGISLNAIFCLGMSVMFFARAFVEVDFLGPFGVGVLIFFSMLPRLAARDHAKNATRPTNNHLPQSVQRANKQAV
jgi:exopolysaccharide production protein ExoQ